MKTVKKIWNGITTVVVVLVVILALLLVGVRLLGFQVFTVLSGSMEPTYKTGSLIYVKDVDPMTLTDGDVITFMLDEDTVATHRIVGVVPDENDPTTVRFRTKGDANDFEDGQLVHYKNVLGTPKFTIPGLGYVANYIQHPPGLYFSIAAAVLILLLAFLPDLLEDDKPQKKKKNRADREEPEEEPAPSKGRKAAPATMEEAPKGRKAAPATMEEDPKGRKAAPAPVEEAPKRRKAAPAPVEEAPKRRKAAPAPVEEAPKRRKAAPAPVEEAPKRRKAAAAPVEDTPRAKAPSPQVEELVFDLEQILADFRDE